MLCNTGATHSLFIVQTFVAVFHPHGGHNLLHQQFGDEYKYQLRQIRKGLCQPGSEVDEHNAGYRSTSVHLFPVFGLLYL